MAAQKLFLVGLLQDDLNFCLVGRGDVDRNADWDLTSLDSTQQAMFTLLEKTNDASDIFNRETGLTGDCRVAIAPLLQALNVVEQIDGAVLAAGKVLHQAHHQAILSVSLDDEGGYLALAEHLIRLKSTLAADEVVAWAVCIFSTGDRDRPLQTEFGDVLM